MKGVPYSPRRTVRLAVSIVIAACCTALAQAAPLPLAELLNNVDSDPALKAEYADLDAARSDQSARQSEKGWQAFVGAGVGNYHELVVQDVVAEYYGRNLGMGVRYPLLGSLKRQVDAITASGFAVERQQLQLAMRRTERRLALRNAYADWWRAQQEQALCAPLRSAADQAFAQLQRREQAGWILAADASQARNDWQTTLKPCMTTADVDAYRARLELVTQAPIPADATAVDEALAVSPMPFAAWENLLEQNPRVASAANRLEEAGSGRNESWYDNVEANVSVGYYLSDRAGVPYLGHSLVASINLSIPFDVTGLARSHRDASQARYNAAIARLDAERRNVLVELTQALHVHQAAVVDAQQSDARVVTATERLRELRARTSLDGDQTLLLQTAERERYQAAFARIDAWYAWWMQDAGLRVFGDGGPEGDALLGERLSHWQQQPEIVRTSAATTVRVKPRASPTLPAAGSGASRWEQGTYIWNSHALLDAAARPVELAALRAAGMQRIYVGLDSAQVGNLAASKEALRALLDAARAQHIRVDLLLGDPAWLKPANRGQLVSLVNQLADVGFAGLNLDLEVDQLGQPVPDRRLKDWLDTVAAVTAVSPWPVSLSSHYRWFDAPAPGRTCVPCALPGLGVREVSLMIYTRNPQRSTALAAEIARRWPALQFRLAQSIETQLPADESWAGAPPEKLDAQSANWKATLAPDGVTGIDWQDWRSYPRQPIGSAQQ